MSRLWLSSILFVAMVTQSLIGRSSSECTCKYTGEPSSSKVDPQTINIQISSTAALEINWSSTASTSTPASTLTPAPTSTQAPTSTPAPTTTPTPLIPRDCADVQAAGVNISGVYPIYPNSDGLASAVYCDMETDGGGWTVIQRRQDGSVDFFVGWDGYKYGFGNAYGEHWLGNDNIHRISTQKTYELRIDLENFHGETRYASYNSFRITDEASKYTLTIGDYSGDAGDSLTNHQGRPFSTKDNDNDRYPGGNCAVIYAGGWWYNFCHAANLNGWYLNGQTPNVYGVVWRDWLGYYYSLKKTTMKIRPI